MSFGWLATFLCLGCGKLLVHRSLPGSEFAFNRIISYRKEVLNLPARGPNATSASVYVFGLPGGNPTVPPIVDGKPLLDYTYERENVAWQTPSQALTLIIHYKKPSTGWPKDFLVSALSMPKKVSQTGTDQPKGTPVYASDDVPPNGLRGITPFKEKDIHWFLVLPMNIHPENPPAISVKEPYACFDSEADAQGKWGGAFIAFLPDSGKVHITVDGEVVEDPGRKMMVILTGDPKLNPKRPKAKPSSNASSGKEPSSPNRPRQPR